MTNNKLNDKKIKEYKIEDRTIRAIKHTANNN